MRRAGFTIVEILMATVIIAIIAAITLSVISSAKAKASQAVCLSNVGQLTKAILIYADQNDGGTGRSIEVPWTEVVSPRERGPLRCALLDEWSSPGLASYDLGGFAQNECNHRRLPSFESSKTVLLTEAARFVSPLGRQKGSYQPHFLTGPDVFELAPPNLFGQLIEGFIPEGQYGAIRHGSGSNYAMCDGHVKWLRPDQLRLPVQGYGCQSMATIELRWRGPDEGPYFSTQNTRR